MLETHQFVNLINRYPGQGGSEHPRGDHFPMAEAREAARKMMPWLAGKIVVLLGKNVRDAFGFTSDFFEPNVGFTIRNGSFQFVVAPHPSGVSHWWNDPANVERARHFFREELPEWQ